jgi:hypothetical protein
MKILEELDALMESLGIKSYTGEFAEVTPDTYVLLTPISDDYDLYADDSPTVEVNSVRISLFAKKNYLGTAAQIFEVLLNNDFSIKDRRFVAREVDKGYNHYAIDCEKIYIMEGKDNG